MRAIELRRLSIKEQSEKGQEVLLRQKDINKFTVESKGIDIVKTFEIMDVSGTSVLETPEIAELISLIKSADIQGVVVADVDRLMRPDNFNDFGLLQKFKETNTKILLPDQTIDLNTQSGTLIGGLQALIAGNELVQIKKRMMSGKETKRKEGKHPNGDQTLPFGVGYDRSIDKFFYKSDAYKVKQLFELFYFEGIHNYQELDRRTGFHHRNIPNLLSNQMYIGYRVYDEKRGGEKRLKPGGRQGDRPKVPRKPDEIIRKKVIGPPLIQEDIFWQVQEIMGNKTCEYRRKRSKDGERFLYSGFLRCGVCGKRMYPTSGGKNHKKDYYICCTKSSEFKKIHGDLGCPSKYIPRAQAEHTVTAFILEKITDKKYLMALIETALSDDANARKQQEIGRIQESLKEFLKKRSKLLDLYLDGKFPKEELDTRLQKLNTEISAIKNQLKIMNKEVLARNDLLFEKSVDAITSTLVEFSYWTPHQKRIFLRSQFSELSITKEGITGFTLNVGKDGNRMGMDSWQPPA